MYCTKCGAEIADGSKFCDKCGAKFEAEAPVKNEAPARGMADEKAPGMDQKTLITIIVAAIAAVILVVILCCALTGGPKKTVKAYLKAQEALVDEYSDLSNKYTFYGDKCQKKLDMLEDDDDDDDTKSSWKISKVTKYGKKDDVTEGIKEYISAMNGEDDKVKGSAIVEVTTTVKSDGDKNTSKTYYTVIKVGGSWYILDSESSAENTKEVANYWEDMAE